MQGKGGMKYHNCELPNRVLAIFPYPRGQLEVRARYHHRKGITARSCPKTPHCVDESI